MFAVSCKRLNPGFSSSQHFEPQHEVKTFGDQENEFLEAGRLNEATELNLSMWVDGPYRNPQQVNATVRENVGVCSLVLNGALDTAELLTLAAKIPNTERIVINNSAHMLSMEQPRELHMQVRDFIRLYLY